jgi:hypothetical protein
MTRPPSSPRQQLRTGKVTLIDIPSIREATDTFAPSEERVQTDFSRLKSIVAQARTDWTNRDWEPAELTVAAVSIDPKSEGQQRFTDMLRRHFEVDASYYRENFVSTPPGRHPAEVFDREKGLRPFTSVAPRLAYTVGRLAHHSEPQVLVVTHCFELHYPLMHLAQSNKDARVGLAYFGSLLDHRWKLAGIFDRGYAISFFDLDPFASEIFGGIELNERKAAAMPPKRSGLDLI